MEHNLSKDIIRQKPYNRMFVKWLNSRAKILDVRKASYDEDLEGVDYFVKADDGTTYTVQLKVDFRADKTGNLPFEAISQAYVNRNSVIGAEFNMEKTDLIFFLLVPSLRLFGYKFKDLLAYVINNYKYFKNFGCENKNKNGKHLYYTLGVLIPMKRIHHLVRHEDVLIGGAKPDLI